MNLHERFQSGIVLDGGLATELERRGENLQDALWSARLLKDNPKLISAVHTDYLEAGASVITSASYQCSFEGLEKYGVSRKHAAKLMKTSVQLASDARELFWESVKPNHGLMKPFVAASLGSYGATLANGAEFTGNFDLSMAELRDWHRPRFEVLAESGADILAFETIPVRKEAEAIARLLEEAPSVSAWISFSCQDEQHVGSGERLIDCFEPLHYLPNVVALGINCTAPQLVTGLMKSISDKARKPIIVYPNSGEIWNSQQRTWGTNFKTVPLSWNSAVQEWWNLGVRGVGGCCRTTPDTIREIASTLFERLKQPQEV